MYSGQSTYSHSHHYLSPFEGHCKGKITLEVDGMPVDLEIWDTAGEERFASMAPLYYRRAQAAIVVYDITDKVHTCIAIIDALINSVGSQTHFHMILLLVTTCRAILKAFTLSKVQGIVYNTGLGSEKNVHNEL